MDMRAPEKTPFVSGHRTFDRQTTYIGIGNVSMPTQYSKHIRPYHLLLDPFNRPAAAGSLQAWDLGVFRDHYRVSLRILARVQTLLFDQGGWLYLFHHRQARVCICDGLVLTTLDGHHLQTWILSKHKKTAVAVIEARRYVAEMEQDDECTTVTDHEGQEHFLSRTT